MSDSTAAALRQHNADYGFDGSFHTVPPRAQALLLGASCAALMTAAAVSLSAGKTRIAALAGFTAAQLITTAAFFIHTTRRGKFGAWADVLRTRDNAALENVADRVEVHTADITDLPFDDSSVDVIVSSLVIHNIPTSAARAKAVSEAARALRPGGRLAIADLWATRRHARQLAELGFTDVRRRSLGWRMWWGGPWAGTHLVTATRPAA